MIKPPCPKTCRLKCFQKLTEIVRLDIFKKFWNLGDINRQRDFISKYVEITKKKRERLRATDNDLDNDVASSRRHLSFFYSLPDLSQKNNKKIKVCQTFFLNTLSVSHQMVKTVANKSFKKGQTVVENDKRGRVTRNSRLPTEVKQYVREHINSVQRVESHYTRQNSAREFLPSSLNITRMYELYKIYCSEKEIARVATFSMYRQVFLTEFNLSFHLPKKDQCDLCNKYKNSNENQKSELEAEIRDHLKAKEMSRQKKESDKEQAANSVDHCVAAFDLQKVLIAPKADVSQLYYKRKLSTYNLTVYDISRCNGYCFMWHEGIASRGACEIGSSVLSFIKTKVQEGNL